MPTLSRYFVRSALLCLGIGFTIGGLILAAKGGAGDPRVWGWLPAHILLLLDGWLVQLSLGVAYWILPRVHISERGRRTWAWSSFIVFQIGILFTLVSLLSPWWPSVGALIAPAVIIQGIGIGLFAIHALPRIRPAFIRRENQNS